MTGSALEKLSGFEDVAAEAALDNMHREGGPQSETRNMGSWVCGTSFEVSGDMKLTFGK